MSASPVMVRITAATLKRTGLFEARSALERFETEIADHRVVASFSADLSMAQVLVRNSSAPRDIVSEYLQVKSKPSGFGNRHYFICPLTNDFSDSVYLLNGSF